MTVKTISPAPRSKPAASCSRATGNSSGRRRGMDSLPPMKGLEIAFAGRSNVGKSIADQRAHRPQGAGAHLAHARPHPGAHLLPGPGRSAPRRHAGLWLCGSAEGQGQGLDRLIHAYLRGRANLARVYVLIDARHGLKDADQPALDLLRKAAVSHQIVLTKCDQIPAKRSRSRIAEIGGRSQRAPRPFLISWRPRRARAPAFRNCARPSRGSSPSGRASVTRTRVHCSRRIPVQASRYCRPVRLRRRHLAAAGAHSKPGSGLDSAGHMLLFHAPAVIAACIAIAAGLVSRPFGIAAAIALLIGVALFAGDLALRAYTGQRLFPMAAPTGGMVMMGGWVLLGARGLPRDALALPHSPSPRLKDPRIFRQELRQGLT